ncbi:MAG: glycosyltransferase [Deltaproteobacteria bacterium]
MKVLSINTVDARGGAARAAYALHKELKKEGYSSKMLVGERFSNDPDVFEITGRHGFSGRTGAPLRRFSGRVEELTGLQYFFSTGAGAILRHSAFKEADVVHLHNTHGGYLNLRAIKEIAGHRPVVWTLHDMWPITGHCAHSFDCEKWRHGCGQCPYLSTYPAISIDTTRMLFKAKRDIYEKSDFLITAPSRWLIEKFPLSMLSSKAARLVPNAIDAAVFRPKDPLGARKRLGLPADRFIAMFAASGGIKNPWKGFSYIVDAFGILKKRFNIMPYVVIIGEKSLNTSSLGIEAMSVGEVGNDELLSDYYAAADAYLLPSIAENSPLTALESLATGAPVICFNAGGAPELVLHKKTGYIAAYKDANDLADGIRWAFSLNSGEKKETAKKCVEFVKARHTIEAQAKAFLGLYETCLRQRRNGNAAF